MLVFTLLACVGEPRGPVEGFGSTGDAFSMADPVANYQDSNFGGSEVKVFDGANETATGDNGIENDLTIYFPMGLSAGEFEVGVVTDETLGQTQDVVAEYQYTDSSAQEDAGADTFTSVRMFSTGGTVTIEDAGEELVGSFSIELEGETFTIEFSGGGGLSQDDPVGDPASATMEGSFTAPFNANE